MRTGDSNVTTPLVSAAGPVGGPTAHKRRGRRKGRRVRMGHRFNNTCHLLTPVVVVIMFVAVTVFGVISLIAPKWYPLNPLNQPYSAAIIAVGVLGPLLCLCVCMCCSRPSKKQRMKYGFYGDALLQEMLSGENITDHYDVEGENNADRGTVVFLSGLSSPRTCNAIHTESLSRFYRTISVDLPGHGTLTSVPYSLARCERVLRNVLERECEEPVILVAYGASAYVGMHFVNKQRPWVRSLVLGGKFRDFNARSCMKNCWVSV